MTFARSYDEAKRVFATAGSKKKGKAFGGGWYMTLGEDGVFTLSKEGETCRSLIHPDNTATVHFEVENGDIRPGTKRYLHALGFYLRRMKAGEFKLFVGYGWRGLRAASAQAPMAFDGMRLQLPAGDPDLILNHEDRPARPAPPSQRKTNADIEKAWTKKVFEYNRTWKIMCKLGTVLEAARTLAAQKDLYYAACRKISAEEMHRIISDCDTSLAVVEAIIRHRGSPYRYNWLVQKGLNNAPYFQTMFKSAYSNMRPAVRELAGVYASEVE